MGTGGGRGKALRSLTTRVVADGLLYQKAVIVPVPVVVAKKFPSPLTDPKLPRNSKLGCSARRLPFASRIWALTPTESSGGNVIWAGTVIVTGWVVSTDFSGRDTIRVAVF